MFCAPCNEGSGLNVGDIIQPLTGVGQSSGVGWASASSGGGSGTSVNFTGSAASTGSVLFDGRAAYSPASFTVAVVFYPLSTGGSATWQSIFSRGGAFEGWDWLLTLDGSNLNWYGGAGASASALAITQNAWHIAVGTAASGGNQQLTLDGSATSSISAGTTGNTTIDLSMGRGFSSVGADTSADIFSGQVSLACIWDRVLSSGEITSFTANPWQLFLMPSGPMGGGAGLIAGL